MPLDIIELDDVPDQPTDREWELLSDASERAERLIASGSTPAFIPCDAREVGAVLRAIHERSLAPGDRFCEWGAGIGTVAAIASLIGYESYSIEIDGMLVHYAQELANDHGLDVQILHGSFVPQDAQHLVDLPGEDHAFIRGGADVHDEEGLDVDDFAVIFAFPWPGEEEIFERLFEERAAQGALLVTYHGLEGVCVRRKT